MELKDIENVISDYHWMSREVDRLESILFGTSGMRNTRLISQYGIEATLPKGSPLKSDAELAVIDRREQKLLQKLERYSKMTAAVEHDQDLLEDDFHKTIYDCMMDGMSYRAIGKHLGISRGKFYREKETILNTIYQKDQKSQIVQYLREQESDV